jgi:hypothetical protein
MFTLLFVVLPILLVVHVVRLFTRPYRSGGRFYNPYFNGYGYGYGCRRHRGWRRSLFSILALVALDRLITGRRF